MAYHFHWSYAEILAMEHAERRRFCRQISSINDRMNTDDGPTVLSLGEQAW